MLEVLTCHPCISKSVWTSDVRKLPICEISDETIASMIRQYLSNRDVKQMYLNNLVL